MDDVSLADGVTLDDVLADVDTDGPLNLDALDGSQGGSDAASTDLPPVTTPVKPNPGQAGACLVREVLTCGESAAGYLSGAPSAIDFGCSFIEGATEGASHGYAIWSPSDARATLRLAADATATRSLFVRTLAALEDACDPIRCEAWAPETVVTLAAGEIRYVMLSSILGEDGDYTIGVDCCTPSCEGRSCGSDGCGGSCGACAGGTRCDDTGGSAACAACAGCECTPSCPPGACGDDGCGGSCGECVAGQVCASSICKPPSPLTNDGCSSALAIEALPFEYVGTTETAGDDISSNGPLEAAIVPLPGCLRVQGGGKDAVFRYTASAPVDLTVELHAGTGCPDVAGPGCGPGLLMATTACPFEECVAATDVHTGGPRLRVPVAAGETRYFIVDGYDAAERGPYRLRVTSDTSQ